MRRDNRRSRYSDDSDDERRSSKRSRRDEFQEIDSESEALRHPAFEDWLWDEKRKRTKDLSREDRGHYARKFRGRWNAGKLSSRYDSKQSYLTTSDQVREAPKAGSSTSAFRSNAVEELQLRREREAEERDQSHQDSAYQRKKDRREARQEAKDSQSVGKEKLLEQRAALRSSNAEFAARKDETDMAFTDDFLGLDGGNSFQQALAAREKRKAKPTAKQLRAEEKAAEMEEKRAVYNEKESATMDMFKALAKERFG